MMPSALVRYDWDRDLTCFLPMMLIDLMWWSWGLVALWAWALGSDPPHLYQPHPLSAMSSPVWQ